MSTIIHRLLLLLVVCSIPAAASLAQKTVIQAAGYVDVAAGVFVEPAVVVVSDGRIESVNPASIPEDATAIDLGDRVLLPGLFDMHTHLTGNLEGDWVHRAVKETAADAALRGAANARKTTSSLSMEVHWKTFP